MQTTAPEPEEERCVAVRCSKYPLLMQVPSTGKAVEWALAYLGCTRMMTDKPCVVLDIDGTVLLNSPSGSTKCVKHFKSLSDACSNNGITLFCITARPEESYNRTYTLRQLDKCGIAPVNNVYMRPPRTEYATYKSGARKSIVKMGYSILLTIGDQFADITIQNPPPEIDDTKTYVGQMGDNKEFGIKLSSEFT